MTIGGCSFRGGRRMNYHVRLEISFSDDEEFDFTSPRAVNAVADCLEEYLRGEDAANRDGRLDWLTELRSAFAGWGDVLIKSLDEKWTADLSCHVSARFPEVEFWARGIGESSPMSG